MTYYILSWDNNQFEIFHLNDYERLSEYCGMTCSTRFESRDEAQEVIDWILKVLGTKVLLNIAAS